MIPFLAAIPGVGPVIALGITAVQYLVKCAVCMIALAIGASWLAGDVHGHRKANAACRAADLAMQLNAEKRDASILADTIKFKESQLVTMEGESADLKKRLDAYEADRPNVSCPLGVDRAGRLRNILAR